MQLTVVGFGIAKDILGSNSVDLEVPEVFSVADLKARLFARYPAFEKLRSLAIAVNSEYARDDLTLQVQDDIVLIPPVSGG